MRFPAALMAIGLALALPLPALAQRPQADPTVDVARGDPEMARAIARARAELPIFFGHASSPSPGERYFLVKYNINPAGRAEFIWAEVISHKGDTTLARLINTPRVAGFAKGQQVTIRSSEVIDWSYLKDGVMQGNYTTRIVLPHMKPADAAALRKAYGW
ncbi:DUF2314 domain-containing protein [Sphingomonas sp. HF-S3]|uniref:DUF2314 domain-containing protein n=1 Tax=Sphingomonas rustica TaxID=3103142 RepID=A0ABV0B8C5_9SPHN